VVNALDRLWRSVARGRRLQSSLIIHHVVSDRTLCSTIKHQRVQADAFILRQEHQRRCDLRLDFFIRHVPRGEHGGSGRRVGSFHYVQEVHQGDVSGSTPLPLSHTRSTASWRKLTSALRIAALMTIFFSATNLGHTSLPKPYKPQYWATISSGLSGGSYRAIIILRDTLFIRLTWEQLIQKRFWRRTVSTLTSSCGSSS